MFSSCTVPPDNKQTKLESRRQEPFASAGKNTGIYLVPCCTRKCVPIAIYSVVDIPVLECHLLRH